jgi:hypothetical protein
MITFAVLLFSTCLVSILLAIPPLGRNRAHLQTLSTLSTLQSAMADYLQHNAEPTVSNWQAALQSDPAIAKQLSWLPTAAGKIIDGWGTPIHFIPSSAQSNRPPIAFFQSAGPDAKFDTLDDMFGSPIAVEPKSSVAAENQRLQ